MFCVETAAFKVCLEYGTLQHTGPAVFKGMGHSEAKF